ncbi:unnamed protein product [Phytomonas sp. Hart1]|nr:unnamed protein product [Phytomonas sp. Hart1]|eukprot:CCW67564.1 unnamed protein product [Phytomonas sp. isolate Hart1]
MDAVEQQRAVHALDRGHHLLLRLGLLGEDRGLLEHLHRLFPMPETPIKHREVRPDGEKRRIGPQRVRVILHRLLVVVGGDEDAADAHGELAILRIHRLGLFVRRDGLFRVLQVQIGLPELHVARRGGPLLDNFLKTLDIPRGVVLLAEIEFCHLHPGGDEKGIRGGDLAEKFEAFVDVRPRDQQRLRDGDAPALVRAVKRHRGLI